MLWEDLAVVARQHVFLVQPSLAEVLPPGRSFATLLRVADEPAAATAQLQALLRELPTGGKQAHDANSGATMRVPGSGTLLTANTDDLPPIADRIAIVPLTEARA